MFAMPRLRQLVAASDLYTSSMSWSFSPANLLWQARILSQRCPALAARTRLTEDMAPALTSGLMGLFPCNPSAVIELKAMPLGSTPIFLKTSSSPDSWSVWQSVNTLEHDWMENE